MGIGDKISGRVKQAAGDLTGNDDLQRQGAQEERKGEAEQEARKERIRAEATEQSAEERQEAAEERAAAAAKREFDKADRESQSEQARADAARERAERKEGEVEALEHSTDPGALKDDRTKEELYDRAQDLGVEGRSDMNKDELAEEVARRE
jgi:uncharacterized protein YjbJ (UPF0337 family)